MGVGQHLLICITTDTLLDQENGARNNKGLRWFPGGLLEVLFPCLQPPPSARSLCGEGGRRSGLFQTHSWPQAPPSSDREDTPS